MRDRTIKALLILSLLVLSVLPAQAISVKTETLQSCSSACDGAGTSVNVSSYTTVVLQVCCTFTGTVTFKTSVDGTNFDALECFSTADKTARSTTATARGQWRCNMIGMNKLEAEISGYANGTITVTAGLASAGVN